MHDGDGSPVSGTGRTPGGAPFTGLSHLQLVVSDIGASSAWYRAALGMDGFAEDPSVGYVALRHPPSGVVIVLTARPDDPEPGPHPPGGALDHVAFAVPDGDILRTWADHLTSIGIHHGGIVLEDGRPSLQLLDPDRIAVELVAPAPPVSSG